MIEPFCGSKHTILCVKSNDKQVIIYSTNYALHTVLTQLLNLILPTKKHLELKDIYICMLLLLSRFSVSQHLHALITKHIHIRGKCAHKAVKIEHLLGQ